MRSHNLVFAALAALTDLGAVAAPVTARGVNDANENPSSLQILSNKIPSNFRFEASALVLPSPEDAEEQASQGGSGVEITRTGGDEETTVLRTHDVVPLGRGGNNNNNNRNGTSGLTRPLLAGGGGQASPLGLAAPVAGMASSPGGGAARAGGSAASATSEGSTASAGGLSPLAGGFAAPAGGATPPWAHAADNSADNAEAAAAAAQQQQQQEKRAESPLAGVQELPGQAIKLSNAPVPDEAVKMPTEAIEQAAAALPDNPSPAGAVAATQEMQEMPAQAMAAAGGMIPAAAAAAPQQPKQKRGDTNLRLPALSVDPAEAKTDVLGVHVFNGEEDKNEPKQRRGSTSVKLPAFHMDSAEVTSNSVGLNIWEKRQRHAKRQGRENTAEGCRRHAAELGPNRHGDSSNDKDQNNNNGPAVVELRPVAQVEPVASLRPAADIKLPSGAAGEGGLGLMRTLGLQARGAPAGATAAAAAAPEPPRKRQVFVNLPRPRPRPRPSSFIPPIVVAPQVRPAVGLQRRTMRRGARATAA